MYLALTESGKHLAVTKRTKPQDVIQALGAPTKSWDDGVEKCLTYESKGRTVHFIFCVRHFFFKPAGKLKGVEIEENGEVRRSAG